MPEKIAYALNRKSINTNLSIISCYDTYAFPPYKNVHSITMSSPDLYCIIVTYEGCGKAVLNDGRSFLLEKNTIFFGTFSLLHYIATDCGWKFESFWFKQTGINYPSESVFTKEFPNHKEFTEEIISLIRENSASSISLANSILMTQVLKWIREYAESNPLYGQNATINEITAFICDNLHTSIKVKDIASHFHYCERYINELFNKNFGMSPKAFINEKKMDLAQSLLLTTDYTVSKISEMLGYDSPSHFMTAFKNFFNMTPSAFKEKKDVPSMTFGQKILYKE